MRQEQTCETIDEAIRHREALIAAMPYFREREVRYAKIMLDALALIIERRPEQGKTRERWREAAIEWLDMNRAMMMTYVKAGAYRRLLSLG